MSIFTERFNKLRKESGKTQAQVASELDMTPQAISYIAKGREPNLDLIVAIARLFGVTTDFLLGASDHESVSFSNYEDIVRILLDLTDDGVLEVGKLEINEDERDAFYISNTEAASFFREYWNMVELLGEKKITHNIFKSWITSEFGRLREIFLPRLYTWEEISRDFDIPNDMKPIIDSPTLARLKAGDIDGKHN
jgi:transcriptional regulator with XRE-family HTH domain